MSDVSEEAMRLEALEGSGEGGELEQAESMLAMLDENDALCECQRYLRKHGESASAELVLAIVTHCINVRMDAPAKCLQQVLRLAVAVAPPRDLHSQVLASLISNIAPLSDDPVEHVPGPQPGADRIAILVEALSLLMPRLSDRKRPWAFVRHSEDAVHRHVPRTCFRQLHICTPLHLKRQTGPSRAQGDDRVSLFATQSF